MGSLFQTRDAVDEKDIEVAIDVFLNGADMVIEDNKYQTSHARTSDGRGAGIQFNNKYNK